MLATMLRLVNSKILIIGPGPPGVVHWKLFRFLSLKCRNRLVTYVGHPLLEHTKMPHCTEFLLSKGGGVQRVIIPRWRLFGPLSIAGDLMVTLWCVVAVARRYDLCVAVSPHLAFLALLMQRLHIVRQTVFWTIDYFPQRFRNRVLNWIYLKLDEICTSRSDYTWDISPAIIEDRKKRGVRIVDKREMDVPFVVGEDEIEALPLSELKPCSLIYAGNLKPLYGFELIVEAMSLILREKPDAFVTVVSYGHLPKQLETKIKKCQLQKSFRILGYVSELELRELLRTHRVGLAPYRPDTINIKMYADPSRVKNYMAKGLPVIVTRTVRIAKEVESEKAGIVINYDREELAEAILKLLSDEQFYNECRKNAIKLASKYKAEAVFLKAFERMGIDAC